MKTLRLLALMAVCCATGTMTTSAWAAEPPPAKPAPPVTATPANESATPKADEPSSTAQPSGTAQSSATPQSPATPKGTQSEEKAALPPPAPKPKASGKGGSPERFVPSEQVRADFDVSFPIDI